jgi:hypothetical protein
VVLSAATAAAATANSTVLIRGTNLGSTPGPNVASFFANTSGVAGGQGLPGLPNMSVRGDYLVDTSATGTGLSFATYWPGLGFRPLSGTELLSNIVNSTATNANLGPSGTQAFGTAAAATVTLGNGASYRVVDTVAAIEAQIGTSDQGNVLATASQIAVTGALTMSGLNAIQINVLGGYIVDGTYTLLTFGTSTASTFSASRMGVRLMPHCAQSFSSSIQLPGSSSRAKICSRKRSATCSYSAVGDSIPEGPAVAAAGTARGSEARSVMAREGERSRLKQAVEWGESSE